MYEAIGNEAVGLDNGIVESTKLGDLGMPPEIRISEIEFCGNI